MALGLTQNLSEMSTRNISRWVQAAGVQDWQPYHLHVPIVMKSWSLYHLEPSGPVQALHTFTFIFLSDSKNSKVLELGFLYGVNLCLSTRFNHW